MKQDRVSIVGIMLYVIGALSCAGALISLNLNSREIPTVLSSRATLALGLTILLSSIGWLLNHRNTQKEKFMVMFTVLFYCAAAMMGGIIVTIVANALSIHMFWWQYAFLAILCFVSGPFYRRPKPTPKTD